MIALDGDANESFLLRPLKRSRWGVTFRDFIVRIEGEPPNDPIAFKNAGHLTATDTEIAGAENAVLAAYTTFPPGVYARMKEIKPLCPNHLPRNLERAAKALAEKGRLQAHSKTRGCYCRPVLATQGFLPAEEEES